MTRTGAVDVSVDMWSTPVLRKSRGRHRPPTLKRSSVISNALRSLSELEMILIDIALVEGDRWSEDEHLLRCIIGDISYVRNVIGSGKALPLHELYTGPYREISQFGGVPEHKTLDRTILHICPHVIGYANACGENFANLPKIGDSLRRSRSRGAAL